MRLRRVVGRRSSGAVGKPCGCAGAGRRVAGAGYADARAGAVIISGGGTKKNGFLRKKIQKTPPEELGRARARLYTDGRAFFACHLRARARTLRVYGNPRPKIRPEIRRKERDGRGACAEIAQMRRGYGAVWQPQRGRQPRQYPRARTPARTVGGCVHGQT